jgi:hypothetical protein
MEASPTIIGRVTRCSIRGFVGGIRLTQPDIPAFGALCSAPAQRDSIHVIGLIYDISIEDDELARQLAVAAAPPPAVRADSVFNRPIPIELSALSVGYESQGVYHQSLPPQPPVTLAEIRPLNPSETQRFTERLDFLPLILSSGQLPVDDLLAALLRGAAEARPPAERRAFLLDAAAQCARWMARDLMRLETLLRNLGATTGVSGAAR